MNDFLFRFNAIYRLEGTEDWWPVHIDDSGRLRDRRGLLLGPMGRMDIQLKTMDECEKWMSENRIQEVMIEGLGTMGIVRTKAKRQSDHHRRSGNPK